MEGSIGRDALLKGIRTVLNIADADLREEPERLTATFLARALFVRESVVPSSRRNVRKSS